MNPSPTPTELDERPRSTDYGPKTRRLLFLGGLAQAGLDNPIFVKHLRSRLRRAQFLPSAAVVLVLCLCIAYGGYALNGFSNGVAFGWLLGLQSILLAIIGATQVATAVGGARESGIIDFHRVSPLSPTATTLGFFFGAPVREYALFLLTIPFSLICVANDAPGLGGFVQTMVSLFLSAWLLHSLALLTALSSRKPKAGKGVVGLVVFLVFFGGQIFLGVSRAATFVGLATTYGFFGLQLPWLLYVLLFAAPTLSFLLLASVRKMQSDRAHPYTKPEAAACLGVLATLILGAVWGYEARYLSLVVLYILVVMGCVLVATVTPNAGEFAKGVRRAERRGTARLSYWDDLSLNRIVLVVLCGIVLAGATFSRYAVATDAATGFGSAGPVETGLTIAIGVLVVAYVGLALQYFLLSLEKRGTTIMGLFLFFVWGVPLLVAAISGAAGAGEGAGQFIAALSPVAGLALSTDLGNGTGTTTLQAATLVPALIFVFLFNNLVTVARRRAVAAIHAPGPDVAKPRVVADPLGV